MKKLIVVFSFLLFAVWLGVVAAHNDGYVVLVYRDISFEVSLWFALVVIIIAFFLFYAFLRFSSGVRAIASRAHKWFENHWRRRAHMQTILGLYEMVEGKWDKAEKRLLRHAKHSDMPLINCVSAAFVAQNRRDFKRRDSALLLIPQVEKGHSLAVQLSQVILCFGNRRWQDARNILQSLYRAFPKNVLILQLLHKAYWELKEWQNLERLLFPLRKYHVLDIAELNQLEHIVYKEILLLGVKNNTAAGSWQRVPRYLCLQAELVAIYTDYLIKHKKNDEAEDVLKMALHRKLDPSLLILYTKLKSADPIKQLMRAEKWLHAHPSCADLLLCLGRLCYQQKLWGKARNYLEKSLKLKPCTVVYGELARLAVEQNDIHGALNFYAKSVQGS